MSTRHISTALLAFFVLLLLFGYGATYSPSYQACQTSHSHGSNNERQKYTDNFIPASGGTIIDCESFFANENGSAITAISTVFLTLATGLLGALAYIQFTTSRAQLSAFVFVDKIASYFEINPTAQQPADENLPRNVSGWAFRPAWTNSGETQTAHMVTHVDHEYRDSLLPEGFPFSDNNTQRANLLLGPKSTLVGGSSRTFSVAELQQVKDGTRFLYVWGWTTYKSIFEPRRRRITRYCVGVVVIGDPAKSNCTFSYPIPNRGTCSDDECRAQGLG